MTTKRLSKILAWISPSSKGVEHKKSNQPSEAPAPAASVKNWKNLPEFDDLPMFKNMKGCAWEVWGKEDQLGTINLLTEEAVKRAAAEEIITGTTVSLNWPLQFPSKPLFGRKNPEIKMIPKAPRVVRDDEIHINTQSGTQWDGLRHFGLQEHGVFYNNTPQHAMAGGIIPIHDPLAIDPALAHIGIQNWANHGICGRGVLLDMVRYYTAEFTGVPTVGNTFQDHKELPYDPWTTHGLSVLELEACADKQGVKFRQGDILILRVGFIWKYQNATQEGRDALAGRPETFAGIEQSEDMKRFLWNNHFAAIASDQPALERWPTPEGTPHMHQTLLGLWGIPIGEMFDVEKLSEVCAKTGRYTFFFSSWPLAIIGGCASPPNAAVGNLSLASNFADQLM
ncbi:hypothetical protein DFH05DRAFT_1405343 [Lentinula detonsa]|uniref:Cyclase n=1 Tax=Lentinula detonsa TaxID=2804962 RepID=A0A9W8NTB2_9AGAR|nr:hypothetical protein DFH05DRAFT_1405343 [Lentinula detonsa]